ncbi:MAG TPA: hypothetical protein PLH43_00950 [Acetivibrio sp.]|uniref:hypothetical protein n=1 Tax=Acetivibrio sp. TaxID=1872092 RepID=UPI002D100EE6|nr:hypothetical protein [Acetivibrio sp.]HOM01381.1 hypothetical protein [Acetivibrio sp.]
MKKFFYDWVLWKHIAFSFVVWLLLKTVWFNAFNTNPLSIGVIGGADGPTSIIVTGEVFPRIISYVVLIAMLALYVPVKKAFGKIKI